jgi:hypothetical protein
MKTLATWGRRHDARNSEVPSEMKGKYADRLLRAAMRRRPPRTRLIEKAKKEMKGCSMSFLGTGSIARKPDEEQQ